jgi:hypothetical protein
MKTRIKVGDLVKYKERYLTNYHKVSYKMGIAIKMFKCSAGREIHIIWSNGSLTQTNVNLLRRV